MIELLKGDSYELIKTIPDKSIDLVYIDIPYLITGGASKSQLGARINKLVFEELKDIKDGIDYAIFDELVRIMKHIYIYIWCSKEQILDIMKLFIDKYHCKFNLLVWAKTNPAPLTNSGWLPDLEYCLVFKEDGARPYNEGYDIKSKYYVSSLNVIDKEIYGHPTIKPLEFVERHIKHSTVEGDTVLDCFMGSGTTGVACRNLNRNFIGIEIDEQYFEIAKKRIETQVQELRLF